MPIYSSTLVQRRFELCRPTYTSMQIFSNKYSCFLYSVALVSHAFTNHGSKQYFHPQLVNLYFPSTAGESADADGWLYSLFLALFHKELEHLQILVYVGVLETIPSGYWGTTIVKFWGSQNIAYFGLWGCQCPNPWFFKYQLYFAQLMAGFGTNLDLLLTPREQD